MGYEMNEWMGRRAARERGMLTLAVPCREFYGCVNGRRGVLGRRLL